MVELPVVKNEVDWRKMDIWTNKDENMAPVRQITIQRNWIHPWEIQEKEI